MGIHYLEIVTSDQNSVCSALETVYGAKFSDPIDSLGRARVIETDAEGRIGVRLPMHESESPVVRPYTLVEDIDQAINAVEIAGGEIIHAPLEIAGMGKFAIYVQGGIQLGLWQI